MTSPSSTTSVTPPRLCGRGRTAGAAYIMTSVPAVEQDYNAPIDAFLICPPRPIPDYLAWGISPSGMTVIEDLAGPNDHGGQTIDLTISQSGLARCYSRPSL